MNKEWRMQPQLMQNKNRLSIFACTSSIGPGATNMVTAAATATTNRIPLLLLPGIYLAADNRILFYNNLRYHMIIRYP